MILQPQFEGQVSGQSTNRLVQQDQIDLSRIFRLWIEKWQWFAACLLVAFIASWIYNRYSGQAYEVKAMLLIDQPDTRKMYPLSVGNTLSGNAFEGFNIPSESRDFIANQMAILKSRPLLAQTLESLDFEVSYFAKGRIIESELYKNAPFTVIFAKDHPQVIHTRFRVNMEAPGNIRVSAAADEAPMFDYQHNRLSGSIAGFKMDSLCRSGDTISGEGYSFSILLNQNFYPENPESYSFIFNSMEELTDLYHENLFVSLNDKESTAVVLKIRDKNIQKGIDFLNRLSVTYLFDNLRKKNEIANRTIEFIDQQLENVSGSLARSESRKQSFQLEKQVINFSLQTEQLLQQASDLDKQRQIIETQNKYYTYLNEYITLNKDPENILAPSSMGIDDPLLTALVLQINNLLVEKSSLTSIKSPDHYKLRQINAQIESLKRSLIENTQSLLDHSNISLMEITKQITLSDSQLRRLPSTERDYINIERKYNLDAETYTFLLQKLSEAQIAKASNISDGQVLEEAGKPVPVKPRKRFNYAVAMLIAIVLPAGILFMKDIMSLKIRSIADIKKVTDMPVLSQVMMAGGKEFTFSHVLDQPNDALSESFRCLRNKISIKAEGLIHPVIAVASANRSEGRSFLSANIAASFALAQKKTMLLDLDIRNSEMITKLSLPDKPGVVDYVNGEAGFSQINVATPYSCLDVIAAGKKTACPGELFMNKRFGAMMEEIRKMYEIIIVDTGPVMEVSDLYQISRYLDFTLFAVKNNYTGIRLLSHALNEMEAHRVNIAGLIINCVNRQEIL